ncbi:MAG: hypothetical protein J0I09_00130 [Sphingobacteriia bacterium]|nr:hypothetical protein [Sphingobacteriia bacterium]
MDAISISVYHLLFITNLITKSFEGLGLYCNMTKEKNDFDNIIRENVTTNILIRLCSLRDEYNRQFLKIEDKKIDEFKYLCEPIWERIDKWTEIVQFRNNVLAHNLRDKKSNYKSVFLIKSFDQYDIPNTIKELIVLVECVKKFRQLLYDKFKSEYDFAQQQMVLTNQNRVSTKDIDYEKEINDLLLKLKERE